VWPIPNRIIYILTPADWWC